MNGKLLDWAVELQALAQAGLDAVVQRVIAVQDRERHNAPRYAYKVCKVFVLCTVTGGQFRENSETTESAYFPPDALPELAMEKNTPEQVQMCFDAYSVTRTGKRFLSERGECAFALWRRFPPLLRRLFVLYWQYIERSHMAHSHRRGAAYEY